MQTLYKYLTYQQILIKTNPDLIIKDGQMYYDGDLCGPFILKNYINGISLGDYNNRVNIDMIKYMLGMYDIKRVITSGKKIMILHNGTHIKLKLRYFYGDHKLNDFSIYEIGKHKPTNKMILFVSIPLKFINKMRNQIILSNDANIKKFFAILEENVIKKLSEPYAIYLVLKAIVFENMIVDDVMNMVAVRYIDIISSFDII